MGCHVSLTKRKDPGEARVLDYDDELYKLLTCESSMSSL